MVDSSDSITTGLGACHPAGRRLRSYTVASTPPVSRNQTGRLVLTASPADVGGVSRMVSGGIVPMAATRTLTICTGSPRLSWP